MPLTALRDFQCGQHEATRPLIGGGLAAGAGTAAGPTAAPASGTWTGPVRRVPLDWAVPSWNGRGERIEVQIRAATPGGWSPWFSAGAWSDSGSRGSLKEQAVEGVGRFAADTLLLDRPARAWQMRVLLQNATLDRLFVATALRRMPPVEEERPSAWGREIPVEPLSQMVYPGGNVWCSPTSLAMVMSYWGIRESVPEQVVPGVYDPVYGGHGNWSFNTAYAGARGLVAWVDRFRSFAELEGFIEHGIPVIASVKYARDWLPNAPLDTPSGHLLVVTGFADNGDVIVNDPAFPDDASVRTVYRRDLFRRAWLERGGVVYMLRPSP